MTPIEFAFIDLMERVKKLEAHLGLPHVTYLPPMYGDGAIPDRRTAKPKKGK